MAVVLAIFAQLAQLHASAIKLLWYSYTLYLEIPNTCATLPPYSPFYATPRCTSPMPVE